ncbi:hypothetical protein [Actinoplanes sp. NPDC049118]|uniref:hypothetical protein n=1 Tax=Actinoplanes sp. NPDC049118 TaxID=3155769 RepID=UPI0034022D79
MSDLADLTRRFPDVHVLLIEVLTPLIGAGRVATQTPADLAQRLPFARVTRTGGHSDRLSDHARVDVDVFHKTYTEGEQLAARVHEFLTGQRLRAGNGRVDRVGVDAVPIELPWAPGIRRFTGRYLLVSRRAPAR